MPLTRLLLLLLVGPSTVGCGPAPSVPLPLPPVVVRPAGSAAAWVPAEIDGDDAVSLVAFLEQRFRLPGNLPYREALEEVESRLRVAGFGSVDRLVLERWTLRESAPTWEPLAGSLEVVSPDPEPLLSFVSGADRDRTMILIGSPGADPPIEAELIVEGEDDPKNRAVLARGMPEAGYRRLAAGHAAIVLFSPDARMEGDVASVDAIPFGTVAGEPGGPVAVRLSRRVESRLRERLDKGERVVVRVQAVVREGTAPVEALHAEVVGGPLPGLAFVAHLDEPGAEDNASGVAATVALAGLLGQGLRRGNAPPPNRSFHFIIGPELDHADEAARRLGDGLGWAVALDQVGRPVAGGTRALVERIPDPSLRWPAAVGPGSGWLSPGESAATSWSGAPPSLLADALVGLLRETDGEWTSHPYEGGSDHVPFLAAGIPSALIWKFPDPTYHTNLDRFGPSVVSQEELESVGRGLAALGASLGWEDGDRVLSAVEPIVAARDEALADASAEASCAWGGWLEAALSDLERVLGPAAAELAAPRIRGLRERAAALQARCGAGDGSP